jgi:hypothetical protein
MSTEMVFVFTLIAYVIISAMLRVSLVDIRKRVRIRGRVDAKLDLLLKEAGIEFDPGPSPRGRRRRAARSKDSGNKALSRRQRGWLKGSKRLYRRISAPSANARRSP